MSHGTVLILAGPEYEDLELWYPKLRLEEAGYTAPIAGIGAPRYLGKWGYPADVDGDVSDWSADSLAGVVVPGGWAPDKMRRVPAVLELVRELDASAKLVASICHGPWVLISAGVAKGRRMTGSLGIKDDVENAGATWVDEAVVIDGHVVTSRVPKDLPAFGAALVHWLAARD